MNRRLRLLAKRSWWLLALFLVAALVLCGRSKVFAQGAGEIRLLASQGESQFPKGMLFQVQVESAQPVKSVTVRFRAGGARVIRYAYLDLQGSRPTEGQVLVRTDTADRYIPPGTEVTYYFEIEDAAGGRLETEPKSFTFLDPRFVWEEVKEGQVSVLYYGPIQTRARGALQATLQTIDRMGKLLGVQVDRPLRVVIYNNVRDMIGALPPQSAAIRRQLITEGQAFSDEGVVLTLATGGVGVASHEVTHLVVALAAGPGILVVPAWLNEGLAEYGNLDPGATYDTYLAEAIRRDLVLPITSLSAPPGTPDQVILFYGEGKSIVKYMVDTYGPEKLQALVRAFRALKPIDDALQEAYGVDRVGLETGWRRAIGAPPLKPEERPSALPTAPAVVPTIAPFTIATPTPASGAAPAPGKGGGCTRSTLGDALALEWALLVGFLAAIGAWSRRR